MTLADFITAELLADANLGAMFGGGGTMQVSLNNPEEMSDGNRQGVSVWLYRVNRDPDTLNHSMTRLSSTQLRYPPMPMQLHYLVTPMVESAAQKSAQTEQMILGKVIQALHDHPRFHGADLSGDFAGTEVDLHVRLEPMSLEEITRVWSALDRRYQLSVSYEVTLVDIDSMRVESTTTVREAIPQTGVVVGS